MFMPNEENKTIRCFLAVEIPNELKDKIASLAKELDIKGIKLVEPENIHVTLKFLGDVKEDKINNIKERLRTVNFSNFNIKLHGVGVFPNENYIKVVWVGCESKELYILAKKINEALASEFKREEFTAHATIARVKQKVELHDFLEKHKNDSFGEFVCTNFVLKQSELSREGPKYTTLASFQFSVLGHEF